MESSAKACEILRFVKDNTFVGLRVVNDHINDDIRSPNRLGLASALAAFSLSSPIWRLC